MEQHGAAGANLSWGGLIVLILVVLLVVRILASRDGGRGYGRERVLYLSHAPVGDLRWWTGWTMGVTRKALARAGVSEVDIEGVTGVALADDLDDTPAPAPWAALLPSLDPTVMAWRERSWQCSRERGESASSRSISKC